MCPNLHWVDAGLPAGRVAVMPHPAGDDRLEQELRGLRREGVDVIVSLLEPHEAVDVGLGREEALCNLVGIRFIGFPIRDRAVPGSMSETRRLLESLVQPLRLGQGLVFHCWAGIGRSSLMAASLLTLCGLGPDEALDHIGRARGLQVPDTHAQRVWVEAFARGADRSPST